MSKIDADTLAKTCGIYKSSASAFLSSNPSRIKIERYIKDCAYLQKRGIATNSKVYRSRGKAITRAELLKKYSVNPATVTNCLKRWVAKEYTWEEMHETLQYIEDTSASRNKGSWGNLSDKPRPWNLLDIPGANPPTIHDVPEDEQEYFERLMK